MNYEQKYNEALALARSYYSEDTNAFLIDLFPELRESEDERIRKAIENIIRVYGKTQGEWIAGYDMDTLVVHLRNAFASLEKQKDTDKAVRAVEIIERYITERTANAHDMSDANPMKQYYTGVDATLSSISGILQDVYAEKQKEQKDFRKLYEDIVESEWFKKAYHGKSLGTEDEQKEPEWEEELKKCVKNPLYFTKNYVRVQQKEQKPDIELIQRSWYMEGYTDGEFKREPMWNLVTGKGGPRYEKNEKYGQPLEQKEQKPNYCHHEVDETGWTEEYRKAYYDGWNNCNMQHSQLQAEQKPAEWSEDIIQKAIKEVGLTQHQINWFKTNVFPPKQEWSEEDEKMRRRAICACNFTIDRTFSETHYGEARDWLKSLPIGFITNPNYNSDMVELLVSELQTIAKDNGVPKQYDAEISWLKSLRPSWKPSEDDLDAFKELIDDANKRGWVTPGASRLYEQLKAL